MRSPFPGMDPYLELYWRDVHHRLVTYAADALQPSLPSPLRARVQERVFVESDEADYRAVYPDVHVFERGQPAQGPGESQPAPALPEGSIASANPLIVHLADEPYTQGYVEIIDAGSGNRVVAVLELLSPSNKFPGEGRDLYLKKCHEIRAAGVSLVEIDLTRAGRRATLVPPGRIPPSHRTTYQVCVLRGWAVRNVEVYRAPLEESLPAIQVPLRKTDSDVPLELQSLVDRCYENGRYDVDYRSEPVPPLEASDAAWADKLLRAKGLRP